MAEERRREPNPIRITMRGIYAVGIGLAAAAIWWRYSDQVLGKILPLIGFSV